MLLVGVEEPLDLAVRLGSSNLAGNVFDVMLVEIPLGLLIDDPRHVVSLWINADR